MASIIQIGDKWRAQVRKAGHPAQTKTFTTKRLAEQWARQVEADIEAGRAGVLPRGGGPTVGKLIERYTEEVGSQKPFGRNKADVLKKLHHHLGAERLERLTADRLLRYFREERRVSGVTAAIDMSYLSAVLRYARTVWRVPFNPAVLEDAREAMRHAGMIGRSNERDRRPTPDEIERLRGWLRVHSRSLTPDIIDFILDSGFRPPSEIVGLRWADLHREDRTIVIRDRKHPKKKLGNHMTVPLLGRSFEIIERQPRTESEFIFPVNGKSWSSIFPRACRELGIEDLQLYDLRHEAISRLVESGRFSIPEIMLVAGHLDPKQTMRYTQLRARDLHKRVGPAQKEEPPSSA